ncbi:MAG: ATP-binding cassette domain-containing protein [Candidatus Dojkabacteria bacterium]|nr:ATP-binding cassette domain-containing protein [Candidatus Dojkabacteria bacterium]
MLSIKNLTVEADGKEILRDVNLEIGDTEKVVLFGPNGCGKSTLFKVIMGLGDYKIKKGSIEVGGKSLKNKSVDKRVKLGLGYIGQKSAGIKGLTLDTLMKQYDFTYEEIRKDVEELNITEFLDRDLNYSLSGGEIKRVELFTLSLLKNLNTYLLDELDSGVDLENIERISKYINRVAKNKSIVLTTHTGSILKNIDVDTAYVMLNGQIICKGAPKKVWECINNQGYEKCVTCDSRLK